MSSSPQCKSALRDSSLRKDVHSLEALCEQGFLKEASPALQKVVEQHPVSITQSLLEQIDPNDPNDPIGRQYIPTEKELVAYDGALEDPIGDNKFVPMPGLIHRYEDRLLFTPCQACPAYCRFCFRRGRVGPEEAMLSPEQIANALSYIREHKKVWEVIFSGGEPLMLSPRRLQELLKELHAMEHIGSIRIHTRVPISCPERITPELVEVLTEGSKPFCMFIHCNHPRDLYPKAREAIALLTKAGIRLYSQSVLLRGVNDTLESMTALMKALLACGITPRNLYHPGLVRGCQHFRVPLEEGRALMRQMRGTVSGLCQPHYLLEIPGGVTKIFALSDQAQQTEEGWLLTDYEGKSYLYKG